MRRAPARVGDAVDAIDTPALILRRDAFDANLAAIAERVKAAGLDLRPHGKAHKCVEIARRQLAAGAVGVCTQKVDEAEVFIEAGIPDVLIANEVVGPAKWAKVAALAGRARVAVCVDHPVQVAGLARAAAARGVTVDVLIEVDVGQGRCGVRGVDEALALACAIDSAAPALRLRGLQAYHGRAQHLREPAERAAAIAAAGWVAGQVRDALRAAGHACDTVSGAGTGSLPNELAAGLWTEVQPGSYVLMDGDYRANRAGPQDPALAQALYLLTTVISARDGHAVVDGGLKATSAESGLPLCERPGWSVSGISDEHVTLRGDGSGAPLAVGDRLALVPSHCDPTVNLHDWIVVVDGERVEAVWPVDARGALG